MIVFGFDSGLRSFGWAVGNIYQSALKGLRVHFLAAGVWTTEPNKVIRRKGDDTSRRTRELWRNLSTLQRQFGRPQIICVEAVAFPFGKTQSSVISGLGRARALVDVLAQEHHVEIFESLPTELKEAVTGNRSASKDEMCEALETEYRDFARLWPRLKADREHVADACASILACRKLHESQVRVAVARDEDQEIPF